MIKYFVKYECKIEIKILIKYPFQNRSEAIRCCTVQIAEQNNIDKTRKKKKRQNQQPSN